jgi:hypothetical protein
VRPHFIDTHSAHSHSKQILQAFKINTLANLIEFDLQTGRQAARKRTAAGASPTIPSICYAKQSFIHRTTKLMRFNHALKFKKTTVRNKLIGNHK